MGADSRPMTFTVGSANVNGLRAAACKGFLDWLATSGADVVCLQETRAEPDVLPAALREPEGWCAVHAPGCAKGRQGVAVLTRTTPEAVRVGFAHPEFDDSGRYLEVDLPGLTVASLYLPKGEVGSPRQEAKERFMAAFLPYLIERREKAAADGREVLVCGDWNIAHRPADLKNWRANQANSGFLPQERAWLDQVFGTGQGHGGYVDVVRGLHPDRDGPYTWWSYRGRAFDNDVGWRIDFVATTPGIAARAVSATVHKAPRHDQRFSDHAPLTVRFGLDVGRPASTANPAHDCR